MKLSGSLRVLIDCSTFLSGILYEGNPHKVLQLWVDDFYTLHITNEILTEYKEKIEKMAKKMKKDSKKAIYWFALIKKQAIFDNPTPIPKDSCRDPNDLIYLEASSAAEADYLVSSDKDLLVLKKFQKTKILTPAQFLEKVKSI
jgi:putative PIN family toxin of toxin-antitoxin system